MKNITFTETGRGFVVGKFNDINKNKCSIQESSLATEAAIWLGIDDPKPEIMSQTAIQMGLKQETGTESDWGWCEFKIPDDVVIHTRMHLTVEMVKELIPVLQHFVETGYLPEK